MHETTVAALRHRLREVLAQIRRADAYESARLSGEVLVLTQQLRQAMALGRGREEQAQ